MEATVQIDGKNYNFGDPQNNIGINEITRNNQNLKSIFAYFDKNGDNSLSKEEIEQAFKTFTMLDKTEGKSDRCLTDNEIKKGLGKFPDDITTADYKNFIRSLASTNFGKKLADDLYKQISGPSLNSKTLALLSKIDQTNVLEVLRQYNKLSPKESLAFAIDNEWGLDIEDVKSKICSPLISRAKVLNINNVTHKQYQEINSIENLDKFINNTIAQIEAEEIRIAKDDSIEPIKRNPQYKCVYNLVDNQLVKRITTKKAGGYSKISDLPKSMQAEYIKRAEKISKMVLEKCQKYDIEPLAPAVAEMLAIETGGYNFTPSVMVNPGKSYKGVMQVDFKTCQCIYAEGSRTIVEWHKAHFSQDDTRINELKKKYHNAEALYEAIQTDVELGLEVGIIALKAKIHEANNSVKGGISKYCNGGYECRLENIPKHLNTI